MHAIFVLVIVYLFAGWSFANDPEKLKREARAFLHQIESAQNPWIVFFDSAFLPGEIEESYRTLKLAWNRDQIGGFRGDHELQGLYLAIGEALDAAYVELKERSHTVESFGRVEIEKNYETFRRNGIDHYAAWTQAVEQYRSQKSPRGTFAEFENASIFSALGTYEQFLASTDQRRRQFDRSLEILARDPQESFRDQILTDLRAAYQRTLADEKARSFAKSEFHQRLFAADIAIAVVRGIYPPTGFLREVYETARDLVITDFLEKTIRPILRQSTFLEVRGISSYSQIPLAYKLEVIAQVGASGFIAIEPVTERVSILVHLSAVERAKHLPALIADVEMYARSTKIRLKQVLEEILQRFKHLNPEPRKKYEDLVAEIQATLKQRHPGFGGRLLKWCERWFVS